MYIADHSSLKKKCFHENLLLNQFTNEKAKHVFVNFVN